MKLVPSVLNKQAMFCFASRFLQPKDGYKNDAMYANGARKSRSRSPLRKTPVSPRNRHIPQSPVRRRLSRTPERYKQMKPRSPPARYRVNEREMVKPKETYRPIKGRPLSPPKVKVSSATYSEFKLNYSFLHFRLPGHRQFQAARMILVPFVAAMMRGESSTKHESLLNAITVLQIV